MDRSQDRERQHADERGAAIWPDLTIRYVLPVFFGRPLPHRALRTALGGRSKRGLADPPSPVFAPWVDGLVIHATHPAARHSRSCGLLLRYLGDHGLSGNQE